MDKKMKIGIVGKNNFVEKMDRILACYDFLNLFCATLIINNDTYFNLDKLIDFINISNGNNKYQDILKNIYIIDDEYNSFKKAITVLKIDKIITEFKYRKYNNLDIHNHTIIINKDMDLLNALLRFGQKKRKSMFEFVNDFNIYIYDDVDINYRKSACHVRKLTH